MRTWHDHAASVVLEALGTHPERGLTDAQVEELTRRHGANRLAERPPKPGWVRFLAQARQPLPAVLVVSAVVTALLGEWTDAGVIMAVVLGNAWIGSAQESRAEQALAALARTLATEITVVRGGIRQRLASHTLVPGDVVHLEAGDRVPADLRVIEAREFRASEAALTGESMPVGKSDGVLPHDTLLAERSNLAFAGTTVASGRAVGVVVATGDATETGRIARAVAGAIPLETPLTRKMASFSNRLLAAIGLLAVLTFVVGVIRGESAYDMFMAAVALAVGAIPEGLPAAMTVTLAIGVGRLARRGAIIRHLPAVETLGSTTVICSDKTGTLTENQMTVEEVFAGGRRHTVTGTGYVPVGEISVRDGSAPVAGALRDLLIAGALCNDASLSRDGEGWRITGDPTEAALLVVARKGGLEEGTLKSAFPRRDERPFDPARRLMATLHGSWEGGDCWLVKGALERVLPLCRATVDAAGNDSPLDPLAVEAEAAAMASRGLRVLALARSAPLPGTPGNGGSDPWAGGLVFLGLVGMQDPPRPQAVSAIRSCHRAGIRVKMITGDHGDTARAIAGQLGIDSSRLLTGREISRLDDAALAEAAAAVSVFARVEPEHKLRLVRALQSRGEVVAMTGDGVNDAPALRAADIGIAMGRGGTEVAKEAAAMVLTDDDFANIEAAVEEGRGVFDNLVKFITWTLPTNFGEGLVIVAAVLVGATLPISPLQILWINMTTAVLLGLPLAFEPLEAGVMARLPRDPRAAILDRRLVLRIVLVSLLMLAGAFGFFTRHLGQGASLAEARTIAMNVFVFVEIAYLFNCRSLHRSWLSIGAFSNPWIWAGAGTMVALQLLITYVPAMNSLFGTAPIAAEEWIEIAGVALLAAMVVAGAKRWQV